jgi:PAS domain S-box-containing protein
MPQTGRSVPNNRRNKPGVSFPGAFFEKLINAFDEPFFIKDERHRWVFLNDAACKAFGKPRSELIGKSDYDIFPKELADVFWARDDLVFSKGKADSNREEVLFEGRKRLVLTKKSLYIMPDTGQRFLIGMVKDITDCSAAEETIASREEQISTLLESLSDGVFLIDGDARCALVNEAGAALFGVPRKNLLGRKIPELYPGIEHTRLYKGLQRAAKGKKPLTVVDEIAVPWKAKRGKDWPEKEARWLEIKVYPVSGGALCITRDITERRRAMHSLKVRLNFEKALATCSQTLLLGSAADKTLNKVLKILLKASDSSRVYLFENSSADGELRTSQIYEACTPGVVPQIDNPELKGFPYKEGFGRWVERLNKGDSIQGLVETFPESERKVLRAQEIVSILVLPVFTGQKWYGFIGFDDTRGPREWHEDEVRLLRTASAMIGTYLDRVQTQKTLSYEREQLLSVFDSFNQIVYVADPRTYEILYANKYLTDLFGKGLVGRTCYKEFQGMSAPCGFCTNAKILAMKGEPYEWEHRNLKLERDFFLTDRIIRWPDGKDVRLEIGIDITDRKRLETQLRQSQKMEAVGRLAGGVAHDFNNLLTAILGYSELLALNPGLDDASRDYAREIRESAERAGSLTQQLLAFGRRQLLRVETLDLNAQIVCLEGMLKRLIGERVELVSELPAESMQVRADSGQIEQVIVNLVVNARDAMPAGGKILLTTKRTRVDEKRTLKFPEFKAGEYVLLSVSDTGSGMDEETKAHIFEPFFTTKGMGRGTGLGLSIVYGIVKQSGGYIYVQSEVGKGTKFDVYLPFMPHEENGKRERASESPPGGNEKVLVAEDEQIVRRMISTSLRSYGYEVVEAANGKEALKKCKERPDMFFDLLITDVVMPEMGGQELAERLARLYPGLKILFVSGYTDNPGVRKRVQAQEAHFLQKPFTSASLAKKVRTLFDGIKRIPAPS